MHSPTPPEPFRSLTVGDLLAAFAKGSPAPGGGSAAALTGAIAGSLATMVASLSLCKPPYPKFWQELQALEAEASGLQSRLAVLIDDDASAYLDLLAARRLPESTSDELAIRRAATAAALRRATEVPLAVADACACVLQLAVRAAVLGRRSARPDAVVASLLASAALRGAAVTAKVNLLEERDEAYRRAALGRLDELLVKDRALLVEAQQAAELGD